MRGDRLIKAGRFVKEQIVGFLKMSWRPYRGRPGICVRRACDVYRAVLCRSAWAMGVVADNAHGPDYKSFFATFCSQK
jgi:hypothetical protein